MAISKKTIKDIDVSGKRVIMRVDFNKISSRAWSKVYRFNVSFRGSKKRYQESKGKSG